MALSGLISSLLIALAGPQAPTLKAPAPEPLPNPPERHCTGALQQGGLIICNVPDGARLLFMIGSYSTERGPGIHAFGLDTDAPSTASAIIALGDDILAAEDLVISEREDEYRVLEGLDCDKVDARTPEQKEHAGISWVKKQEAFETLSDPVSGLDDWLRPSEGRPSSPFGPTRKYIGVSAVTGEPCETTSVHRGYDIAAPVGTPILAPMAGTVTLADPDLYYEGGTVFLDHGYGLVSVFMHMSALDVEAGDVVEAGEKLGEVGNTGRTTGPHLHWGLKWRDVTSEDRSGDFYIDPALLLAMSGSD